MDYKITGVKTFEFTKIVGLENIEFGENIIIDDFVFIYATNKLKIGNNVHIASFTSITGGGVCVIEDFVALSSGVRIVLGTDDFKGWGFGNSTIPERYRNVKRGKIHIGKFVIIGVNSVILPDVTIGQGVTVGAGSVVTRDLQPWGVYVGNKRIRERDRESVLSNYERYIGDQSPLSQEIAARLTPLKYNL
ncbi:MAG: acyltransferase [Nitrospirae bacterium]|nr:acyltransferase [Nitrospirota bacterium]